MWQQTLQKFELENCTLQTDGKGHTIASCFWVKTNAADPPSVLFDQEAIVPSRDEKEFFDVRLILHVWTQCLTKTNPQNRSLCSTEAWEREEKEVPTKSFWKFHLVVVQKNGKEMYKKIVLQMQSCFFAN